MPEPPAPKPPAPEPPAPEPPATEPPAPQPPAPPEPELAAERAYLATARQALDRMHHDVVSLDTPQAGGEDNSEKYNNEIYRHVRWLRAQALVDMPDVPLFFGRLDSRHPDGAAAADTAPDGTGPEGSEERIYIGRRHVHDELGTPLVIDWRAPVTVPFYRATRADPQDVRLRRRYGFSDAAELTAYEDEWLARIDPRTGTAGPGLGPGGEGREAAEDPDARAEAFLRAEIERPRTGPMRDIVATIQPEQDSLVRAALQPSICVQGAPGTGKTAIGLHRIAYLLYTERERLGRGGGVVIVGPNRSFLSYIRRVLPALGEVNVEQTTIGDLLGRTPGTAAKSSTKPTSEARKPGPREDSEVARLKGDARLAEVLRRALWLHVGTPSTGILYAKGSRRYRLAADEVQAIVADLRGSTRYNPGRNAVAQRLAHGILVRMEQRGESPDDRVQNAVARSRPVRDVLDEAWPRLVPEQVLYRVLAEPKFLAVAAEGVLSDDEQALLGWPKPPRSWKSARWSEADAVLLDELTDLLDRTGSWSHLVVDEAQDLSPMELRALGRRIRAGSATVLGDLAQATTPWAPDTWAEVTAHLGLEGVRLEHLERGFRVPAQIIAYAARLLPQIAPGLGVPTGVRESAGALHVTRVEAADLAGAIASACRTALAGEGSIAVIAADADAEPVRRELAAAGLPATALDTLADLEEERLVVVPATLAKGLEFDTVVVCEPARIVGAEPRGLQRLYVVLTRAVSTLHVLHASPLPAALATRGSGRGRDDAETRMPTA